MSREPHGAIIHRHASSGVMAFMGICMGETNKEDVKLSGCERGLISSFLSGFQEPWKPQATFSHS